MNIAELQRSVEQFSREKGFAQSSIETRTLFMVTEVGELAKEVLRLCGTSDPAEAAVIKRHLELEMYDVVWNVIDLANKLGIDLETAFRRKMEINEHRSWNG